MNKASKAHKNIQQKQGKFAPKKHQYFTLKKQVKRLYDMMQVVQINLPNARKRNQVKPLQPYKHKDDAAKKICPIRENPICYSLRAKHSLRRWQCNKH